MKKLFLLFSLLISFSSFAADVRALKDLFAKSFWTKMYEQNYCRDNIERFAMAAQKEGIDLDNSYIIQFVNNGFDMFGLVAAISVREQGRLIEPKPVNPPYRNIGTSNWNYHAILVADGEIFDFDFTNQPRVLKLQAYFNEQFIPASKKEDLKYKKDKIGPYMLSLYPTESYLEYKERRISMKDIRTEIYLRDYMPQYFK